MNTPSKLACYSLFIRVAWIGFQLRPLSEALLRARAPGARRANQATPYLYPSPPVPPPNPPQLPPNPPWPVPQYSPL
jgi:hypothetical protein